jgi:RNA polymerase sigma-70 factor (ECF subfamily)
MSAEEDPALRVLMADYQRGQIDAFDRLHDALAADLKAYLATLARDATRADDLLQETFLQMHRSRASHAPGQPVRPWVFAIARRVFLMYRRSAGRRARLEALAAAEGGGEAAAAIEAERLHDRQHLEWALQQAPSDGRRAFLLHHLLGLSFREVGERLGIRSGAAKVRSSRAANAMRAWLRKRRDE